MFTIVWDDCWKDSDPHASRRHILQALEEAPRFRAAHKLLLDFQDKIDD